jgi:Predicted membrane protein (DUF2142)
MRPAERARPPVGGSDRVARLHAAVLIIFAGRCLIIAFFDSFPSAFDELAHLSYVLHLAENGGLFPAFGDLRMVDPGSPDQWTTQLNYLNHPPPYYLLMSWLVRALPGSPDGLVLGLRLANVLLAVSGVAVLLRFSRQAGWSFPAQVTFAALIVTNPVLPMLGGIVTNDNLAFFGGSLCCLGVLRLLQGERSGGLWLLIAAGFAVAAVAKLTAALLCGALVAFALALGALLQGRMLLDTLLRGRRLPPAAGAFVLAAFGCLPYVALALEYGSPAPLTDGQAEMLASRLADLPEWRDQRYGLVAYLGHFAWSLLRLWPPSPPQTRLQLALLAMPALCFAIALAGMARAAFVVGRGGEDTMATFVLCGALAIGTVMLVHVGFTYERHLETGWLRGVYPRYYFPLLAVLPAACAWLVSSCGPGRRATWLAGALLALAIGYDLLRRLALLS